MKVESSNLLIHWRRKRQPTPVLLPGKFHGLRSLVGYSPWVTKSRTRLSDFTSLTMLHTSQEVQVVKNPSSSAEDDPWVGKIPWSRKQHPTPGSLPGNSMKRRAWWITVRGATKSWTRQWLSTTTSHTSHHKHKS